MHEFSRPTKFSKSPDAPIGTTFTLKTKWEREREKEGDKLMTRAARVLCAKIMNCLLCLNSFPSQTFICESYHTLILQWNSHVFQYINAYSFFLIIKISHK